MGAFLLLAATLLLSACQDEDDDRSERATPEATPFASPEATPIASPGATPSASPASTPTAFPTAAATATPSTARPVAGRMDIEQVFPNISFSRMVHLTYADDDTDRLFLVLQPGRIMTFPDRDDATATEFMDIRERVSDSGNEEGLLGMAFHPDFQETGHFYLSYTAANPRRSVVSRFSVSTDPHRGDPDSELVILEVPQPYANHNGGHIIFGPDGYLYVGLGDGGSAGDPRENGQDLTTLLGTILRIDVQDASEAQPYRVPSDNPLVGRGEGVRPEIWAYGLRNPWRFNFDRETGALWAGDVGQNRHEEVDLIFPGGNYGWNIMEGFHCFRTDSCDQEGLVLPIVEYGNPEQGCSVTGGYVYRGARLPSLQGAYVYGDYCSGTIWSLRHDVLEHRVLAETPLRIAAFAEGPDGELYILSFDERIYRLRPAG